MTQLTFYELLIYHILLCYMSFLVTHKPDIYINVAFHRIVCLSNLLKHFLTFLWFFSLQLQIPVLAIPDNIFKDLMPRLIRLLFYWFFQLLLVLHDLIFLPISCSLSPSVWHFFFFSIFVHFVDCGIFTSVSLDLYLCSCYCNVAFFINYKSMYCWW